MTQNPALPDLAGHFRHLLEVVKEACCAESRRAWLVGPFALLTWIRERRMRKEREMALQQFSALVEALVTLLEDFRAGKLSAEADAAPRLPEEDGAPPSAAPAAVSSPALGERGARPRAHPRAAAMMAALPPTHGEAGAERPSREPGPPRRPVSQSPPAKQWGPAYARMMRARRPRFRPCSPAPRARPPPARGFSKKPAPALANTRVHFVSLS